MPSMATHLLRLTGRPDHPGCLIGKRAWYRTLGALPCDEHPISREGEDSPTNWKGASDHRVWQWITIVMKSPDVQLQRLLCVGHRILQIVALSMKAGEIRCVDVVAPIGLWLEDEFDLTLVSHDPLIPFVAEFSSVD